MSTKKESELFELKGYVQGDDGTWRAEFTRSGNLPMTSRLLFDREKLEAREKQLEGNNVEPDVTRQAISGIDLKQAKHATAPSEERREEHRNRRRELLSGQAL